MNATCACLLRGQFKRIPVKLIFSSNSYNHAEVSIGIRGHSFLSWRGYLEVDYLLQNLSVLEALAVQA